MWVLRKLVPSFTDVHGPLACLIHQEERRREGGGRRTTGLENLPSITVKHLAQGQQMGYRGRHTPCAGAAALASR